MSNELPIGDMSCLEILSVERRVLELCRLGKGVLEFAVDESVRRGGFGWRAPSVTQSLSDHGVLGRCCERR